MSGPAPFSIEGASSTLAGETEGEGPPIALLHGLTATRRYLVHGSRVLPRKGFRTIAYDARGHGESDPATQGDGYGYDELSADLAAVLDAQAPGERCVAAGHSMGAHTLTARALADPDRFAALIVVGPVFLGDPLSASSIAYWDSLADGLSSGGIDGFITAYDVDLDPEWRETLLRLARDRLALHHHPQAVSQALRETPRSLPFDGLSELEFLDLPTLIVASRDDADPGHPFAVAEAWAARMPRATLVSEGEGESPLAWQGGKLSREIVAFCQRPEVLERLDG